MLAEYAQLSREAANQNENHEQYLLRLTELEVAARSANALAARIKNAGFPVLKDLETNDFSLTPSLGKRKILELARVSFDISGGPNLPAYPASLCMPIATHGTHILFPH